MLCYSLLNTLVFRSESCVDLNAPDAAGGAGRRPVAGVRDDGAGGDLLARPVADHRQAAQALPARGLRRRRADDRAVHNPCRLALVLRHRGRRDGARSRRPDRRSEEHTSELQSLMRISYAVFCLKKKNQRAKTVIWNMSLTEESTPCKNINDRDSSHI